MVLVIHSLRLSGQKSNSTFRAVCCEMPEGAPVVLLCEPPNNIGLGVYAGLEELLRQLRDVHGVRKVSAMYAVHQTYDKDLEPCARDGALTFPVVFSGGRDTWGRLTNLDAVAVRHCLNATLLKSACLVEPNKAAQPTHPTPTSQH